MLIIRFSRVGKRNRAQYKIVLAEKTFPVQGKFIEILGSYDPHLKKVTFKKERILHWLKQGAACSDTVHNLLVSRGVIEGEKRPKKVRKREKGEGKEQESKEQEPNEKEIVKDEVKKIDETEREKEKAVKNTESRQEEKGEKEQSEGSAAEANEKTKEGEKKEEEEKGEKEEGEPSAEKPKETEKK